MAPEARLALTNVRVDGRVADVYAYDDRLVITADRDERVIAMANVERVATRRSFRGARLLLSLGTGEIVEVRRLKESSASVAHRTILEIARACH